MSRVIDAQLGWWGALALGVGLLTTACGASRQSGICGDVNPAPTGQGDVAALESEADAAWEKRAELASVEQAIAAWDKLLTIDPSRHDIRVKLAHAHYFAADSHLWFKANEDEDEAAAAKMMVHYQHGTNQAEFSLGQKYPGFRSKYCARQPFSSALQQLDKDAVPAMYWYATNLGRYALAKSLVEVLNNKDRIKAMMETTKRLDAKYWYYAADRYFGAFYTKIPFPSGDLPLSQKHFEASMTAAPNYLATKVIFAKMNLAKAGNRERFKQLLEEVIAFDLDSAPDIRPENAAEQRKAKFYLQEIDFIVEED